MSAPTTRGDCFPPAVPYRRSPGAETDLRLDANEGSVPEGLGVVLRSLSGETLRRYPDSTRLEERIAAELGVSASRVVVTAGASDALDRTCRAFLSRGGELLVPAPTFGMLRRYAELAGGHVSEVEWWGRFPLDAFIERIRPETEMVCLISPNNPTGRALRAETLRRVAFASMGRPLLFDHVYGDFADEDLTQVALGLPNVLLYRTFSKAWGLAGCRVGFVVAPEAAASAIRAAGGTYPVASVSLALAAERLDRGGVGVRAHVASIRRHRRRLERLLSSLGIACVPSEANFVLVECGAIGDRLWRGLQALGVRVRRFDEPELEGRLRITVPAAPADFERLARALATCVDPQALLFDLDGVLADVEGSYRECVLSTLAHFGVSMRRLELQAEVARGGAANDWDLVARILARRGIDVPREEIVDVFQRLYLGDSENPGLSAREKLLVPGSQLRRWARSRPLGLVTGRPRAEAEAFLDRFGLSELFSVVVTMEDGPAKPDPTPVRVALRRLGVDRAWMLGDTVDDMTAAREAGVLPLGVVAPGDEPETAVSDLLGCGAAEVLADVRELDGRVS